MAMTQQRRMMVSAGVIFAAAAAAGAFAWWGVYQPSVLEEEARAQETRMVPDALSPIEALVIERRGEAPVSLVRGEDGSWRLKAPVDTPADRTESDAVARNLRELVASSEVVPASEADAVLSTYGLERPALVVTVSGAGRTHRIALGDVSPFDGSLYARRDDGPVVLVSGSARYTVDRSAFDLREKRLLRLDDARVESIAVAWSEQTYALTRTGPDRWEVEGLVDDRADTSEVNRILTTLRGLRAIEFPDEASAARIAFDDPAARIRVGLSDGESVDLVMAEHMDGDVRRYFARGSGLAEVVQVQGDAFRHLYAEPFELRHKNVLDFDRDRVRRVEFEVGDARFAAERDETPDGWTLVEPEAAPAERWRLTSLIHSLSDLKAVDFAREEVADPETDLAEYGLASPERRIRLLAADGTLLDALEVGRAGAHARQYATNAARRRVYVIQAARLTNLPDSADTLRAGGDAEP
jgi:hypothetical protein